MDEAGPPYLFVVVLYHGHMDPPYFSILQLETSELPHETPEQIKKIKVDEKGYLIRFNQEPHDRPSIRWLFSPPTSSTEDLYMVPNWGISTVKPLQGYKFNLGAGMCEPITPPLSSEREGCVVNVGGRIYLLGYDSDRDEHSVFQCYDPDKKSWKSLEPFPHDSDALSPIVATAVWGDTILFNLEYRNIWAYDVSSNKWYEVDVEDKGCYYIEGEAVVVGDTIYALTDEPFNLVLALSIEKKRIDGDLVLKCSSKNLVPGMVPINYQDQKATRHLVHLGKDNFCLVQSCNPGFNDFQDIKLTYIKLKGKNSMIVGECVHKVKIQPTEQVYEQFDVLLCFSLPKGATTVLKEGKIFNLDPFPEAVEEEEDKDNDSSQTNIIDEQLAGMIDQLLVIRLPCQLRHAFSYIKIFNLCFTAEGRSIYVRDLPPKVTLRELEMGLKEFGPIEMYEIQARITKEGKRCAYVEFVRATSKQLAIEASPIMIGGCRTEILEKGLTGHTLGDCNQPRRPKWKMRLADLKSEVSVLENVVKKVKEQLDEQRNKALQDTEESNKQVLEMSSKLEETHKLEEEAIDSKDEKKQALDQPKSEGTAVLEEDHVSLFESELEELKIQKSVESAILDSAVNEKKELKLELEVVAESEAAQIKQVEVAKSEPIVTDGIIVKRKKKGKRFPYLESQSATSKQLAIKASPIRIWDCRTEIFAAFTLVDCNRTQAVDSSSFGKNKFKDHGEVSRSKTTCAGGPKGKKKRPYKVAPQGLQKKVKEQLDFSEEERNKALQDAEESNKQPLEKSSKLEETHKALKLEEEAIDSKDEKKQALDQPKSEGTSVLEEDHVSLFGSELEELKIQKSVESAIILDCAVNEIKELKLELEVVAESEAAQKKQAEVAKSELKEAERAVRVMEAELRTLNGQLEQWKKFAVMHSTGNNGNFLNRSLSMGSKYSPGDDDLIGKKIRNVLKKFGISWKKPHKSVLQNMGMIKSS